MPFHTVSIVLVLFFSFIQFVFVVFSSFQSFHILFPLTHKMNVECNNVNSNFIQTAFYSGEERAIFQILIIYIMGLSTTLEMENNCNAKQIPFLLFVSSKAIYTMRKLLRRNCFTESLFVCNLFCSVCVVQLDFKCIHMWISSHFPNTFLHFIFFFLYIGYCLGYCCEQYNQHFIACIQILLATLGHWDKNIIYCFAWNDINVTIHATVWNKSGAPSVKHSNFDALFDAITHKTIHLWLHKCHAHFHAYGYFINVMKLIDKQIIVRTDIYFNFHFSASSSRQFSAPRWKLKAVYLI